MSDYQAVCIGATSEPVWVSDLATDCADAGGSVGFSSYTTWGLPELTLEDGALIAGAILALWATSWFFRLFARMIEDH